MNTTVLIKTFERPDACQRLIDSVRKFYPDIPIIVVDDSIEQHEFKGISKYLRMDFDSGISAGRNRGIGLVETDYVFICDDDCVFTENTDLAKAEFRLHSHALNILGIAIPGLNYCGQFDNQGDTVYYRPTGNPDGDVTRYDFIPNTFLSRTDSLRIFPWDEELKMGEHFAFFHKYKGQLRIGYCADITIDHRHINNPTYDPFRQRATDYLKFYMKKAGIKRRVDLGGNIIDL